MLCCKLHSTCPVSSYFSVFQIFALDLDAENLTSIFGMCRHEHIVKDISNAWLFGFLTYVACQNASSCQFMIIQNGR